MRKTPLLVCGLTLTLVAFAILTSAVDRNNFKKCSDSSFCRRHREIQEKRIAASAAPSADDGPNVNPADSGTSASDPSPYSVAPESVSVEGATATLRLISAEDPSLTMNLVITAITGGSARMRILENNPKSPRYEVQEVIAEYSTADITLKKKDSNSVALVFEEVNEIVVTYSPYSVNILRSGVPAMSFNSRGLMHYEKQREKQDGDTDGMWEETWKSHHDSKPKGPMSLGIDISFPGSEHVYGVPQHAANLALKTTRGGPGEETDPYRLYNLDVFEYELDNPMALYGSIPFMTSHSPKITTGVLWLNAAEMWIDVANSKTGGNSFVRRLLSVFDGSEGEQMPQTDTHWFAETGIYDFFVFFGPGPADVISQYTALTGRPPLPPYFSIAYHQCRWNYNDEADIAFVDKSYDEADIPVDVLWLDIEHTNGKRYMTWDTAKFPDPETMQNKLAAKGRKMVNIVDPHIKRDSGYHIHSEAEKLGLYVKNKDGNDYDGWCWPGSSSWLDFMQDKVREWWGDMLSLDNYKGTTSTMFFWNDMNEPSVFNGPEVTMHKDNKHLDGAEHREVHNIYGMWQQASTAAGLVKRSGGKDRPFVLSRAFFAGSQKYGAIWTGDNAAQWSHLKFSIPMLLSIGMAGLTFSGADVGGFFGNPEVELLVRWYQAGAYQPFFRAHGHLDTKRREPYLYDDDSVRIIRNAIQSRYANLPYWYTLYQKSMETGEPTMRPLWYEYPGEKETFELQEQHLVGADLLVAPVLDAGSTTKAVYFPGQGTRWYDVDDPKVVYVGPKSASVAAPLEKVPVYQRGGSIISRKMRFRRSSALTHNDPFTLFVALDENGGASGTLYVDDYSTFSYQKGASLLRTFVCQDMTLTSRAANENTIATKAWVERVVIMGAKTVAPSSCMVLDERTGNRKNLEFEHEGNVITVKRPGVNIGNDFTLSCKF